MKLTTETTYPKLNTIGVETNSAILLGSLEFDNYIPSWLTEITEARRAARSHIKEIVH